MKVPLKHTKNNKHGKLSKALTRSLRDTYNSSSIEKTDPKGFRKLFPEMVIMYKSIELDRLAQYRFNYFQFKMTQLIMSYPI